jgi:hypothetical protein
MFTVQRTKNAHAGIIPENAWQNVSDHRSRLIAEDRARQLIHNDPAHPHWSYNVRVINGEGIEILISR